MKESKPKAYDKKLAAIIDHTVMQPDVSREEIRRQCELAKAYRFAGICVNPVHIPLAAEILAGSSLNVCTGVGFPLGASSALLKAVETRDAVAAGANRLGMSRSVQVVSDLG